MFAESENYHLLTCLKAYRPCKETRIKRNLHKRLCDSCIYKIERLNGNAEFSSQEFLIMAYAVEYASLSLSTFGELVPTAYPPLIEKLYSLSQSET